MSRAEELAAKAKRLTERQAAASNPAPAVHTPPPAAEAPLAKPVRVTLDLSPARHRDFQSWLNESAVRLGKARLTKQQVLDALVGRLLTDDTLAKLILADLRENQ